MGDTSTWKDQVNGLGLDERTLAHHLVDGEPVPIGNVEPAELSVLVTPCGNGPAKAMLMRITLAEEKAYSLTVIDGKVTVLHAMTEPYKLRAQGGPFVANQAIPPDLVELPNITSHSGATAAFVTKDVPVLDWDHINTELEADATLALVARPVSRCWAETPPPWMFIQCFRSRLRSRPFTSNLHLSGLHFSADRVSGKLSRRMTETTTSHCSTSCTRRPHGMNTNVDQLGLQSTWTKLQIGPDTPMEVRYFRMMGKRRGHGRPAPGNREWSAAKGAAAVVAAAAAAAVVPAWE